MSPIGDIGGASPSLIISVIANEDILKNDPVSLVGSFRVGRNNGDLFGKAILNGKTGDAIPVVVMGLIKFERKHDMMWGLRNSVRLSAGNLVPSTEGRGLVVGLDNEHVWVLL